MIALVALLLAQGMTPVKVCDRANSARCAAVNADGTVAVAATVNVAGAADLAGTATFNANNVCATVITAGEQSVGFHLTAGTLDATLTPYITNQTAAINCSTAGTCTTAAFSSGSTIVVTNPNGVKDVGVNVVGGVRQVQVCTTTYASGSAAGAVTATYLQAASSGGGGGGSVTQGTDPWLVAGKGTAGTPSGGVVSVQGVTSMTALKVDGSGVTQPVSGTVAATESGTWTVQPGNTANTTAWKVDGSAVTQPVSGTVTTTPPSNASTNVAQVAGTTTDTNSGVKSAGTLRVVLATDQPALTNKLLVTPDSVALPANQSVNVNQLAGTTTDTNSGVKSAGTLRVVLATDQPALTNKLLVTPDSVALPANQSVNLSQVAGATTATGHGTAAGALRVELPTDGTGLVGAAQSGTWTVQPGNTANTTAWKVDGSAVTQPVSGTITANQGGAPWSENITQINGTTILTGAGVSGAGAIRVANATSDGNVLATANTGRLQVDVVTGGGSNASVGTDGSAPPASETLIGATVVASPPAYTAGQMKSPTMDTMGNLRTASEINDGEFGTAQAKVLAPGQSPQPKDGALVVAISPNTPINVINIGTKSYTQLTAPTLKTMTVDPSGRPVTVLGPQRAPVGTENAQVVAVSPVPAPICPNTAALSQTASTTVITGIPGKTTYVCKVFVVSTTAQSVSLTEGTGSTCGTLPAALAGSTTVANGMGLAANGGWVEGTGAGIVYTAKKVGDDLCVLQSGAGNVAGSISYVQF